MDSLSKALIPWIEGFRAQTADAKLPSLFCHYTDANGLRGIIENQEIWASNVVQLNDSTEIIAPLKYILEYSQMRFEVSESEGELTNEMVRASKILSDLERTLRSSSILPKLLVACLSEHRDDLSQWRGYSPVDGYCVRFSGKAFASHTRGMGLQLIKCVYMPVEERQYEAAEGDDSWSEALTDLCNKIYDVLEKAIPGSRQTDDELSTELLASLVPVLCRLKNSAFKAEAEWRIIVDMAAATTLKLETRTSRGSFLQFGRVPLNTSAELVDSIVVGPRMRDHLAVPAVRSWLNSIGRSKINVVATDVPFRP